MRMSCSARMPLRRVESQGARAEPASPSCPNFPSGILAEHDILISPSALGSDAGLPQMAEELGGTVRAWLSADELASLLESSEVLTVASGSTAAGVAETEARSGGSPAATAASAGSAGSAGGQERGVARRS